MGAMTSGLFVTDAVTVNSSPCWSKWRISLGTSASTDAAMASFTTGLNVNAGLWLFTSSGEVSVSEQVALKFDSLSEQVGPPGIGGGRSI
jgi:hypothetical protein